MEDNKKDSMKDKLKDSVKDTLKDTLNDSVKNNGFGVLSLMSIKIKLILISVAIIVLYISLSLMFPRLNIFKSRPLELQNSAIIIEGSKKLAQLQGAKFYSELVLDSVKVIKEEKMDMTNTVSNFFTSKKSKETYTDSSMYRITIIGNGTVYAGVDLNSFKEDDISINDSICKINIPNSRIISSVINPSDFNIFIDEGNWSPNEIQQLKAKLVEKVKNEALKNNILAKSNKKVEEMMTTFLKSLGFKKVIITFV